ncbi:serine hydrolase [Streptomyces wuyuanensis]|uniref:serine hydrolase n=1 Tax=Streptomyces wuyuanensis TaxID=1196353 RepID=UPI00343099AA
MRNGSMPFVTASTVKVDILACLLLQRQHSGGLTPRQKRLSSIMIRNSDNAAASLLWHEIGRGEGLRTCHRRLGLRQTEPGPGGHWGLTTTTVTDRLRLLTVLTQNKSPLQEDSRRYVLEEMEHISLNQQWGASAAADRGTTYALKNGWLSRTSTKRWVVNSFGRITNDGRDVLVAALSDEQPTLAVGISRLEMAVRDGVSHRHRDKETPAHEPPLTPPLIPNLDLSTE